MELVKHWATTLDDYVIDIAWSPDGTTLATAASSGELQLHAVDGTLRCVLPGHADGTDCLAWSPDGTVLATGGQDGLVKFWDPAAGQHTCSQELGGAWVEHLAWRPAADSRKAWLAAAAGRKLIALRADGSIAHAFDNAPKSISALAWQPGGACLAVAYFGGVHLWDADAFITQKQYPYSNGIQALTWSPNAHWLVSGNQDPSVHLWAPKRDMELQMSGYEAKVKELSFDHSSHWLATGGGSQCCVWDCSGEGPEGREPAMLPHDSKICAVAFQNHHGLLATASRDGVLKIWSPERDQPLRATIKMPAPASCLAWSPDDNHLAIGSEAGVIYVLQCRG